MSKNTGCPFVVPEDCPYYKSRGPGHRHGVQGESWGAFPPRGDSPIEAAPSEDEPEIQPNTMDSSNDVDELQMQLTQELENNMELQKSLHGLRQRVMAAEARALQAETKRREAESALVDAVKNGDSAVIQELKKQLDTALQDKEALNKGVRNVTLEKDEAIRRVKSLQAAHEATERRCQVVEEAQAMAGKRLLEAEKAQGAALAQADRMQDENNALKEQLFALQKSSEEALAQADKAKHAAIRKKELERQDLQTRIEDIEAALDNRDGAKSRMNEARQEATALQRALEDLGVKYQESERQLQAERTAMAEEKDLARLMSTLSNGLEQRLKNTNDRLLEAEQQRTDLNMALLKEQQKEATLQEQLQQLQHDHKADKAALHEVRLQLAAAQDSKKAAVSEYWKIHEKLAAVSAETEVLETDNKQLRDADSRLKTELDNENERLGAENQRLKTELDKLNAEVAELQRDKAAYAQRATTAEAEVRDKAQVLDAKSGQMGSELEAAMTRLKALEAEGANIVTERDQAQAKLQGVETENKRLKAECDSLYAEVSALTADMQDVKKGTEAIAKAKEALEAEGANIVTERDQARAKLQGMETENKRLKAECDSLHAEVKALTADTQDPKKGTEAFAKAKEVLETENKRLKAECDSLYAEVRALTEDMQDFKKGTEAFAKAKEVLETENKRLKAECDSLYSEVKALTSEINDVKKAADSFYEAQKVMMEDNMKLTAEVDRVKALKAAPPQRDQPTAGMNEVLQKELQELQGTHSQMKETHKKELQDTQMKMQQIHKTELQDARMQLEAVKKSLLDTEEKMQEAHKMEMERLEAENSSLKAELALITSANEAMNYEKTTSAGEQASVEAELRAECEKLQREMSALRERLKAIEEEEKLKQIQLQQEKEELEQLKANLQAVQKESEHSRSEANRTLKDYEIAKSTLKEERKELELRREKVWKKEEELQYATQETRGRQLRAEEELKAHLARTAAERNDFDAAQKKFRKREAELLKAEEQYKAVVEETEKQREEMEAAKQALLKERQEAQEAAQKLQKEKDELDNALQAMLKEKAEWEAAEANAAKEKAEFEAARAIAKEKGTAEAWALVEKEKAEYTKAMQVAQKERTDLEKAQDDLAKEKADVDKALKKLEAEQKEFSDAHKAMLKEKEEYEAQKQADAQALTKLQEQQRAYNDANKAFQKEKEEFEAHKKKVAEVQKQLADSEEATRDAEAAQELAAALVREAAAAAQVQEAEQRRTAAQNQVEAAQDLLRVAEQARDAAKAQVTLLEKDVAALKAQLRAESDRTEAEQGMAKAEQARATAEAKVAHLENALKDQLKVELERTDAEQKTRALEEKARAAAEEKVARLEEEISALKQQLKALEANAEAKANEPAEMGPEGLLQLQQARLELLLERAALEADKAEHLEKKEGWETESREALAMKQTHLDTENARLKAEIEVWMEAKQAVLQQKREFLASVERFEREKQVYRLAQADHPPMQIQVALTPQPPPRSPQRSPKLLPGQSPQLQTGPSQSEVSTRRQSVETNAWHDDHQEFAGVVLTLGEVMHYKELFQSWDVDDKGYWTVDDLGRWVNENGFDDVSAEDLHSMLATVDIGGQGRIEFWGLFAIQFYHHRGLNCDLQAWMEFVEMHCDSDFAPKPPYHRTKSGTNPPSRKPSAARSVPSQRPLSMSRDSAQFGALVAHQDFAGEPDPEERNWKFVEKLRTEEKLYKTMWSVLDKDRKALAEDMVRFEKEMTEREAQFASNAPTAALMNAQVAELQKYSGEWQSKAVHLEAKIHELRALINQLMKERDEWNSLRQRIGDDVLVVARDRQQVDAQQVEMLQSKVQWEKEKKAHEDQMKELRKDQEAQMQALTREKTEAAKVKAQLDADAQRYLELKQTVEANKKEVEELMESFAADKQEVERRQRTLDEQWYDLQQLQAKAELELVEVSDLKTTTERRKRELDDQVQQASNEAKAAQKATAAVKEQREQMEAALAKSERERLELAAKMDAMPLWAQQARRGSGAVSVPLSDRRASEGRIVLHPTADLNATPRPNVNHYDLGAVVVSLGELVYLKVEFGRADVQRLGKLRQEDLGRWMQTTLGEQVDEVKLLGMITQVDTTGDGCVSFWEFVAVQTYQARQLPCPLHEWMVYVCQPHRNPALAQTAPQLRLPYITPNNTHHVAARTFPPPPQVPKPPPPGQPSNKAMANRATASRLAVSPKWILDDAWTLTL